MQHSKDHCHYKSALRGKIEIVEGDLPVLCRALPAASPAVLVTGFLQSMAKATFPALMKLGHGMRILEPLKGDPQIISGESGALGASVIALIMGNGNTRSVKTNQSWERIGLFFL